MNQPKLDAIRIKELNTPGQLRHCEALQQQVWGSSDLGITPVHFFIASVSAGGLVLGAFDGEKLVGFLNGFPAHHPRSSQPFGFHSDMMAVLPAYRSRGIGRQLKRLQRDWCLTRELPWIKWTFDPLQAKNARLNFEYLGVTVSEYAVDRYGPLDGPLNAGLPTDRLIAHWDLSSESVQSLARRQSLSKLNVQSSASALSASAGQPGSSNLGLNAELLTVAVPTNLNDLLQRDIPLALRWRMRVRDVLQYYLERGYKIRRFIDNCLVLMKINT